MKTECINKQQNGKEVTLEEFKSSIANVMTKTKRKQEAYRRGFRKFDHARNEFVPLPFHSCSHMDYFVVAERRIKTASSLLLC